MKTDSRLARCAVKCTLGDPLNDILSGCGHNIRKILAHLRPLWGEILAALLGAFGVKGSIDGSEYRRNGRGA